MPVPVSATVSKSFLSGMTARTLISPLSVNFTALLRRLIKICLSLSWSVKSVICPSSMSLTSRTRPLWPDAGFDGFQAEIEKRLKRELARANIHPSGLDLEGGEDRVDEAEEVFGAGKDLFEIFVLLQW